MDIVSAINGAIYNRCDRKQRKYIGASSIGRQCNREIWYNFNGYEGDAPPAQIKKTFDVGTKLESLLLDYLELAGFNIVRPTVENKHLHVKDTDVDIFQGHMDGLILLKGEGPSVLEIKTARNSSFERFKNHGLKIWSEAYYAQLQSYMGMSGYEKGVLLAMNKDTSDLHHEWVYLDMLYYHELKIKALAISSIDEMPEKINKSPLYYVCNQCQFKRICHE